jgi:hypothetical protein
MRNLDRLRLYCHIEYVFASQDTPNDVTVRTLGTLTAIRETGFDYSWFVLTQKIIEKEFALSGSEQNPDLTGKDIKLTLSRVRPGAPAPVEAFKRNGADFVVARTLPELVEGGKAPSSAAACSAAGRQAAPLPRRPAPEQASGLRVSPVGSAVGWRL